MSAEVALHFDRVRAQGSHDDLRLRIGPYQHRCDSYYLALDDSPTVRGGLGPKLSRLLEQWSSQVASLRVGGGTVYLPYDFSDQCTAWLRVSSSDGQSAEVQAGWSLIEGWGIYPSEYLSTARAVADFDPIDGAQVMCSLIDLAARIDANRATLEATGP
ncbi:hypothetical protein [Streptomyces sp. NBC_01643]|uniref:hypothetical protein n=1 Tax=Streptomyces sp. NBC_01643 TaxID=2975906 RepID=UPI00386F4A07|nr:hypothetical protein OHB03_14140 [Streptomyces sp. NBC_01643]